MRKSNVEYEFLSLLGKFITEYLPVSMNASPNTILSYKCAFRLLFQYLEEKTEIKTGHICRCQSGFHDQGTLVKEDRSYQQDVRRPPAAALI